MIRPKQRERMKQVIAAGEPFDKVSKLSWEAITEYITHLEASQDVLSSQLMDYRHMNNEKHRLTRQLDVAMHGEHGAAEQASLCDLIPVAKMMRYEIEALRRRCTELTRENIRLQQPVYKPMSEHGKDAG